MHPKFLQLVRYINDQGHAIAVSFMSSDRWHTRWPVYQWWSPNSIGDA